MAGLKISGFKSINELRERFNALDKELDGKLLKEVSKKDIEKYDLEDGQGKKDGAIDFYEYFMAHARKPAIQKIDTIKIVNNVNKLNKLHAAEITELLETIFKSKKQAFDFTEKLDRNSFPNEELLLLMLRSFQLFNTETINSDMFKDFLKQILNEDKFAQQKLFHAISELNELFIKQKGISFSLMIAFYHKNFSRLSDPAATSIFREILSLASKTQIAVTDSILGDNPKWFNFLKELCKGSIIVDSGIMKEFYLLIQSAAPAVQEKALNHFWSLIKEYLLVKNPNINKMLAVCNQYLKIIDINNEKTFNYYAENFIKECIKNGLDGSNTAALFKKIHIDSFCYFKKSKLKKEVLEELLTSKAVVDQGIYIYVKRGEALQEKNYWKYSDESKSILKYVAGHSTYLSKIQSYPKLYSYGLDIYSDSLKDFSELFRNDYCLEEVIPFIENMLKNEFSKEHIMEIMKKYEISNMRSIAKLFLLNEGVVPPNLRLDFACELYHYESGLVKIMPNLTKTCASQSDKKLLYDFFRKVLSRNYGFASSDIEKFEAIADLLIIDYYKSQSLEKILELLSIIFYDKLCVYTIGADEKVPEELQRFANEIRRDGNMLHYKRFSVSKDDPRLKELADRDDLKKWLSPLTTDCNYWVQETLASLKEYISKYPSKSLAQQIFMAKCFDAQVFYKYPLSNMNDLIKDAAKGNYADQLFRITSGLSYGYIVPHKYKNQTPEYLDKYILPIIEKMKKACMQGNEIGSLLDKQELKKIEDGLSNFTSYKGKELIKLIELLGNKFDEAAYINKIVQAYLKLPNSSFEGAEQFILLLKKYIAPGDAVDFSMYKFTDFLNICEEKKVNAGVVDELFKILMRNLFKFSDSNLAKYLNLNSHKYPGFRVIGDTIEVSARCELAVGEISYTNENNETLKVRVGQVYWFYLKDIFSSIEEMLKNDKLFDMNLIYWLIQNTPPSGEDLHKTSEYFESIIQMSKMYSDHKKEFSEDLKNLLENQFSSCLKLETLENLLKTNGALPVIEKGTARNLLIKHQNFIQNLNTLNPLLANGSISFSLFRKLLLSSFQENMQYIFSEKVAEFPVKAATALSALDMFTDGHEILLVLSAENQLLRNLIEKQKEYKLFNKSLLQLIYSLSDKSFKNYFAELLNSIDTTADIEKNRSFLTVLLILYKKYSAPADLKTYIEFSQAVLKRCKEIDIQDLEYIAQLLLNKMLTIEEAKVRVEEKQFSKKTLEKEFAGYKLYDSFLNTKILDYDMKVSPAELASYSRFCVKNNQKKLLDENSLQCILFDEINYYRDKGVFQLDIQDNLNAHMHLMYVYAAKNSFVLQKSNGLDFLDYIVAMNAKHQKISNKEIMLTLHMFFMYFQKNNIEQYQTQAFKIFNKFETIVLHRFMDDCKYHSELKNMIKMTKDSYLYNFTYKNQNILMEKFESGSQPKTIYNYNSYYHKNWSVLKNNDVVLIKDKKNDISWYFRGEASWQTKNNEKILKLVWKMNEKEKCTFTYYLGKNEDYLCLESLVKAMTSLPEELFYKMSEIIGHSITKEKAGAQYCSTVIDIWNDSRLSSIVHELFHHWDLSLKQGYKGDNTSGDISLIFKNVSWIQNGMQFSKRKELIKPKAVDISFSCEYGETNHEEDIATFGEYYYYFGCNLRKKVLKEMNEKCWGGVVKYLFIKHLSPFAGTEYGFLPEKNDSPILIEDIIKKMKGNIIPQHILNSFASMLELMIKRKEPGHSVEDERYDMAKKTDWKYEDLVELSAKLN